jgi:hypothetical protein
MFEVTVSRDVFRVGSEFELSFVSSLPGRSESALRCAAVAETGAGAGEREGINTFGSVVPGRAVTVERGALLIVGGELKTPRAIIRERSPVTKITDTTSNFANTS